MKNLKEHTNCCIRFLPDQPDVHKVRPGATQRLWQQLHRCVSWADGSALQAAQLLRLHRGDGGVPGQCAARSLRRRPQGTQLLLRDRLHRLPWARQGRRSTQDTVSNVNSQQNNSPTLILTLILVTQSLSPFQDSLLSKKHKSLQQG